MSLSALCIVPPGQSGPVAYNSRLDSLRGFAAWSVMVVHGFGYDGIDDASPIAASNEYVRHLHLSRAAVLLFFITSGYVIGLTNQAGFSRERAWAYLRKRCLRIVPLYLIAIAVGWLAYRAVTPGNLLANVFFLQNSAWQIEPLAGNRPVWSLHFEAVYYLGFIAVWAFKPRVLPLCALMLLFSAADWVFGGPLSVIGGWSSGALFWMAGLLLAWRRPPAGASTPTSAPLLAFVLLTYAANHLWPGMVLLRGLGIPNASTAPVWFTDLFLLPGSLVVFCAVANLSFRGLALAKWLAFLIPTGTCALLLLMGRLGENVPWRMAAVATAAAIPLLLAERAAWSAFFLRLFRPLGKISYGLYLLHYPCVTITVMLYPWNGTMLNYLGGVLAWLALTLTAAWLCEMQLQPALVRHFKARHAAAAPGR